MCCRWLSFSDCGKISNVYGVIVCKVGDVSVMLKCYIKHRKVAANCLGWTRELVHSLKLGWSK